MLWMWSRIPVAIWAWSTPENVRVDRIRRRCTADHSAGQSAREWCAEGHTRVPDDPITDDAYVTFDQDQDA